MNSVNLIGRLTKDIELRYTAGGNPLAVANFTLAVNNINDNADFIKCVAYGKQAENAEKYLSKGSLCGVSGSIKTGSYEKDGNKTYTTEVVATRIEFLGSKSDSGNQSTVKVDKPFIAVEADDIPF